MISKKWGQKCSHACSHNHKSRVCGFTPNLFFSTSHSARRSEFDRNGHTIVFLRCRPKIGGVVSDRLAVAEGRSGLWASPDHLQSTHRVLRRRGDDFRFRKKGGGYSDRGRCGGCARGRSRAKRPSARIRIEAVVILKDSFRRCREHNRGDAEQADSDPRDGQSRRQPGHLNSVSSAIHELYPFHLSIGHSQCRKGFMERKINTQK